MQCTWYSECFPGETEDPFVWRYQVFVFLCAMFLWFHTTNCEEYSFTTDGYEIFNMRTHLGACRTHEGGSGTNKSAQELIRRDRKKTCPLPCPARGSNPESSDLNSDAVTTELSYVPRLNMVLIRENANQREKNSGYFVFSWRKHVKKLS